MQRLADIMAKEKAQLWINHDKAQRDGQKISPHVMTDDLPNHRALLPAGLRDLLPPDAETEAAAVEALMEVFAAHGYQRVKPPLLEFEDSLLAGSGAAVAEQTFRLMDPDSQRMMGLRADTTPQVARIATTRLASAPRPLRLSYAGQCLRVRGTQLAPDRQIAQAGIELIGRDSPAADAEIVLVGAEALAAVGPDADQLRPHAADAGAGRCWTMPASQGRPGRRWRARSTARTPPRWRGMAAAWRRR